jgi:hypothetical protein
MLQSSINLNRLVCIRNTPTDFFLNKLFHTNVEKLNILNVKMVDLNDKKNKNQRPSSKYKKHEDKRYKILSQSELNDRIKANRPSSTTDSPMLSKSFKSIKTIDPEKYDDPSNKPYKIFQIKDPSKLENLVKSRNKKKELEISDSPKSNPEIIRQSEQTFLNQVSFESRRKLLDERGTQLLNEMKCLNKVSSDPRHLTVIHKFLVDKIAETIFKKSSLNKDSKSVNIFADYFPGFGLISQKLIELVEKNGFQSQNKFFLLEDFQKYMKYLDQIKKDNASKPNIYVEHLKSSPYHYSFMFGSNNKFKKQVESILHDPEITQKKMIVYGVIPWNNHGFFTKFYPDFLSTRSFFNDPGMMDMVKNEALELYFYVSELILAKLKSFQEAKYSDFKCISGVYANFFSDIEIIDEERTDFFYPYPVFSTPHKFTLKPYKQLDQKKMFLIRIKMKKQSPVKDTRWFYLYMSHLYSNTRNLIKNCGISVLCANFEQACKYFSINKYAEVKKTDPSRFLALFNYLYENKDNRDVSHLYLIEGRSAQSRSSYHLQPPPPAIFHNIKPESKISNTKKTLTQLNQNFSGRFIFSYKKATPEVKSSKTINQLNENNSMKKHGAKNKDEDVFVENDREVLIKSQSTN